MGKLEVNAAKGKKGKGKGKMCKVNFNVKADEFFKSRKGTVIQKGNLVKEITKVAKCSERTAYRMVNTYISKNKLTNISLLKIN